MNEEWLMFVRGYALGGIVASIMWAVLTKKYITNLERRNENRINSSKK